MAKPDKYEARQPLIPAPAGPVQYGAVDAASAAAHNGSTGAGNGSGDSVGNGSGSGSGTESGSGSDTDFDAVNPIRLIEVVAQSWSEWGLLVAYMSIFLMAFTVSLEGQVTYSLAAFAVSSFNNHSLLSTVYVVQGVVNAVIKPPMAKIADVFGHLEAFCISVLLCVLGYIQMAASQNVQTYASAQIFYSAGSTGLQILQQVFIADTSDFVNRALLSSLPDSPFLVTVWIGPAIAAAILASTSWRVGYAIWAVILPAAFLPLALSLFLNKRRSAGIRLLTKQLLDDSSTESVTTAATVKRLCRELDIGGTVLLSAGLALILIPLTLVSRYASGWHDPKLWLMIIAGGILLALFPLWESRPDLAPHPLLPLHLLKSRTFCAGCALGFFYFAVFYIAVQPYFYSYLLVALNLPVSRAGPITQTFSFASTIAAILASLVIRRLAAPRPRPFILLGAALYTTAIVVLLYTRTRGASVPSLFFAQAGLGAGAGLMHVSAQLVVQAAASATDNGGPEVHHSQRQYVGVATASFLTLVQVGGAVGSAVSGAVWGRLVPGKLRAYLPEGAVGDADKIYSSVVVACGYAWGSPEREAIARSYQETITVLLWVALAACGPVLCMAGLIKDYRLAGGYRPIGGGDRAVVDGREVEVVGWEVVEETEALALWSWAWWKKPKSRRSSSAGRA